MFDHFIAILQKNTKNELIFTGFKYSARVF